MDKTLIKELLDMVREKIDRLKEMEKELLVQLGESPKSRKGLKLDKKQRPGRQPSPETEKTRREMQRILKQAEKPLSPAQIIEMSKQDGTNLVDKLVRKELSRGKDKLFEQIKHGLWRLKEKE